MLLGSMCTKTQKDDRAQIQFCGCDIVEARVQAGMDRVSLAGQIETRQVRRMNADLLSRRTVPGACQKLHDHLASQRMPKEHFSFPST